MGSVKIGNTWFNPKVVKEMGKTKFKQLHKGKIVGDLNQIYDTLTKSLKQKKKKGGN